MFPVRRVTGEAYLHGFAEHSRHKRRSESYVSDPRGTYVTELVLKARFKEAGLKAWILARARNMYSMITDTIAIGMACRRRNTNIKGAQPLPSAYEQRAVCRQLARTTRGLNVAARRRLSLESRFVILSRFRNSDAVSYELDHFVWPRGVLHECILRVLLNGRVWVESDPWPTMIPWLLRNRSISTLPRIPLPVRSARPLQLSNRLKHSKSSPAKSASKVSIDNGPSPNALGSLVTKYRKSVTPVTSHLQNKVETVRRSKAKKALTHESRELLAAQRKARIGLKLYETLSAKELLDLFQAINRFDVRSEIQTQEHDTIPAVQEMAKNDSQWKLETQTRQPDSGRGQVNAALGKRLSKVYKFDGWTLATKHFWKRLNECFEQQDVSVLNLFKDIC